MRQLRAPGDKEQVENERAEETDRGQERYLVHLTLYMLGLLTGIGAMWLVKEEMMNALYVLCGLSLFTFYAAHAQERE